MAKSQYLGTKSVQVIIVYFILVIQIANISTMLTNKQVFEMLYEKGEKRRFVRTESLYNYLIKHFGIQNDENMMARLKTFNYKFCNHIYSKLDKCNRVIQRFLEQNKNWLNQPFNFMVEAEESSDHDRPSTLSGSSGVRARGRPEVNCSESCERTKRRKTDKLLEKFEVEELTFAAKRGLKQDGRPQAAKLLSEAVFTTPTRAS